MDELHSLQPGDRFTRLKDEKNPIPCYKYYFVALLSDTGLMVNAQDMDGLVITHKPDVMVLLFDDIIHNEKNRRSS